MVNEGKINRLRNLDCLHVSFNASQVYNRIDRCFGNEELFNLSYLTMKYLSNLTIKKNIHEFGYCYFVKSIDDFDKILSLTNEFEYLNVLSINLPTVKAINDAVSKNKNKNNNWQKKSLFSELNNKNIKELKLNVTNTYDFRSDDYDSTTFMHHVLNAVKPLCLDNHILSLS